jgi:hypothetical protein
MHRWRFLFSGYCGGAEVNEIAIPKRFVIFGLILIGLAAAAVWGGPQVIASIQARAIGPGSTPTQVEKTQANNEDALARNAALAGAQAFYTVDYQKGQQDWLDQLCAVSTQTGCTVTQNVIAPYLWSQLEPAKTTTTVQVSAQGKVQEQVASTRDNAPLQIWQLQIQLSAPWPVQKDPLTNFPAMALVVKENGSWKFERFLTEDEFKVYTQKGSQP